MPIDITAPVLTQELIDISYAQLQTIIPLYVEGTALPMPQSDSQQPTYSRKLTKADGIIDWHKPAEQLEREIRAFIEWPRSRATILGVDCIITRAHIVQTSPEHSRSSVGTIFQLADAIAVICGKNTLVIDYLQPAGKKVMTARSFLAGHKF